MRTCILVVSSIVWALTGSAWAAEATEENDLGGLSARDFELVFTYGPKENLGVTFVVGNDLWLPAERFEDGDNWLALVCDATACALQPATLSVEPDTWQGHYDEEPTSGQRLNFAADAAGNGEVSGWFRISPAFAWLEPGAVATYHSSKNPAGLLPERNVLEATIALPDDETARLVPLLVTSSQLNRWQPDRNYSWHRAVLQLRSQDKRQLLPGDLGTCSGLFHPRNYLSWAGDLDRDGNPDYLISYVDADGPVHLFLSTAADRDQLVGLGGVFDSPPFGGECDGPEGFLYFDEAGLDDSEESAK